MIDDDLSTTAHVEGVSQEEQARTLMLIHGEATATRGMIRKHWT